MPNTKQSVIITGGTSGLGYESAKALAAKNWRVIITSRKLEKAQQAALKLNKETNTQNIEARALELASQVSIRKFAQEIKDAELSLHALVCNAGISLNGPTQFTEEGIEKVFGVNHLGHFLLTNLLLESLTKPARVVFVSSGTHVPDHKLARRLGTPAPIYTNAQQLADPKDKKGGMSTQLLRYTTSKLCNVLCANELARRVVSQGLSTTESPINVYSIDPGLMPGTELTRDLPKALSTVMSRIISGLQPFISGIRTPKQSGEDLAWLVTDAELANTTGTYYDGHEEVPASPLAYDLAKAQDLWETSALLSKLSKDESPLV